jgi:hypothetical protein
MGQQQGLESPASFHNQRLRKHRTALAGEAYPEVLPLPGRFYYWKWQYSEKLGEVRAAPAQPNFSVCSSPNQVSLNG